MKGTRFVGKVKDLRFLSPDVAVMHAVGSTVMLGKSEPSPERDSIETLVAVREGGGWRLAAFQNTRVRAPWAPTRSRSCSGRLRTPIVEDFPPQPGELHKSEPVPERRGSMNRIPTNKKVCGILYPAKCACPER